MKRISTFNSASRVRVWALLFSACLFVASVPALAQQDMSNMPGMSKSKPKANAKATSRKKRKAKRKKQTATKHDMNNMPGMSMPGMKLPGMHRRKAVSRRKKAPAQKNSANKNQMGNMPGMNMPAKPSSSPKQSAAPQPSPQQMQMNMPGMQMPPASPSPSPQTQMNMPGMQMPTASPNPQASPEQTMNMPMPMASPSPGEMGGMKGTENMAGMGSMNMDPYFTAINYPVPRDAMMVMALSDFQSARTGNNFFTGMAMVQYGVTSRWTVGFMAEGQKIFGLPTTYGGFRINSYFRLFPHDHLLNFTLYGEYEGLNGAALYKMEVAGFGGEDLEEALAPARRTPVRTFEQRAIMYHDWKRVNLTFNFISETDLKSGENDFGYAWGVFRQPAFMAMETNKDMAGMAGRPEKKAPPVFSFQRLGYGVEMIGALGNTHHFGFDWQRQQHYVGPVFNYSVSKRWTVHVEPAFGLSEVSDPFMLRMGVGYSIDHLLHRRSKTP
jgi:hypothetical protein